jgi:hypothetical protein
VLRQSSLWRTADKATLAACQAPEVIIVEHAPQLGHGRGHQFDVVVDVQKKPGSAGVHGVVALTRRPWTGSTRIADSNGWVCRDEVDDCYMGRIVCTGVPDEDVEIPASLDCERRQTYGRDVV